MKSYRDMLEIAYKNIKENEKKNERFEIPRAKVVISGNKTIITNFDEIVNKFRRDKHHILKFFLKELATSGIIKNVRLFLTGRFRNEQINRKIELYYKYFVECPECKRPDTKFLKDGRFLFLKCEACGAKHVVKRR